MYTRCISTLVDEELKIMPDKTLWQEGEGISHQAYTAVSNVERDRQHLFGLGTNIQKLQI